MVYIFLLLACAIFIELFLFLRIWKHFGSNLSLSKQAMDIMKSSTIEDDEKGVLIRRSSLSMLKGTVILTGKFLLIILVLYALYFLSVHFSLFSRREFVESISSPLVLLALLIVSMIYVWIRRSIRGSAKQSETDYNFGERLLHEIAFSVPMLQKGLCNLENDVFSAKLKNVVSQDEVFVTSLPRAGTTLLLNLLYETGEFATFTYRQMPFVLAPLLWNQFSRPFQRTGEDKKRAHGDGMKISYDSPEAFEEIIWLAYLKDKIVNQDSLSPLSQGDSREEFTEAIRNSAKKCIILKCEANPSMKISRYLSKNNPNISRIDLLRELFPTSKLLVPFRHPLAHISSSMTQHERFLERHKQDNFSRKYMKWLGHLEFGENFKPINFDGWLNDEQVPFLIDYDFWIRYWTAAYTHVLEHMGDHVQLVDFDALLKNGEPILGRIAGFLGLENKNALVSGADTLRSPTTKPFDSSVCSPENLDAAIDVYKRLQDLSI
jgi:hypothetical protein